MQGRWLLSLLMQMLKKRFDFDLWFRARDLVQWNWWYYQTFILGPWKGEAKQWYSIKNFLNPICLKSQDFSQNWRHLTARNIVENEKKMYNSSWEYFWRSQVLICKAFFYKFHLKKILSLLLLIVFWIPNLKTRSRSNILLKPT